MTSNSKETDVQVDVPRYVRELGRKVLPGETVTLPEEVVAGYNGAHPGFFKSPRVTGQRSVTHTASKGRSAPSSKKKRK